MTMLHKFLRKTPSNVTDVFFSGVPEFNRTTMLMNLLLFIFC